QALRPAADGEVPVAAHLLAPVELLQGAVVEGDPAGPLALLGPDQGFVGIGEADAPEVGYGVHFRPRDVVEDPVAFVLEEVPDAVDVVVGADDPDAPGGGQDAPALLQPALGEAVVLGEAAE